VAAPHDDPGFDSLTRAAALVRLATELQQGLLPRRIPSSGRWTVATLYEPGERRMLLGGDFIDVHENPDGSLALLVGDVSGHGSQAAAFAVGLRAAWRALLIAGSTQEDLLGHLDAVARSERGDAETFATVCSCHLPPGGGELLWISAGHPPPLLVDGEATSLIGSIGPPLGLDEVFAWPLNRVAVDASAAVVLYTDGLIDGRRRPGDGARFGLDGLVSALTGYGADELDGAGLRRLVSAAEAANGEPLPDDVALVAIRPLA
jgi:serine phosphatase RsbU (regulator of sigma subunit)